jgi:hypothetical protein
MGEEQFAALADVLLSAQPAEPVADAQAAEPLADESPPIPEVGVPRGLYLLVPAGIDPAGRRDAALTAARRLAPHREPATVFVFENGLVEAHVLGERACGRLGPQNYPGAADMDRTVSDLLGQCDQIGLVVLDPPNGRLHRLGRTPCRTVFLATPDAESIVETYRTLKAWRFSGTLSRAAVLFVGPGADRGTGDLGRRLRRAAQGFLGCDLAIQHVVSVGPDGGAGQLPQALRVFSQAPADQVWPPLLAAAGHGTPPATVPVGDKYPPAATAPEQNPPAAAEEPAVAPAAAADVCPAFDLWRPDNRRELISAIQEQAASLFGGSLKLVFQVDVDEPGAPPLAAVRDDGALVAILLAEPGETVDTGAAERWLRVHASLLARAFRPSPIAAGAELLAVALAPLEAVPASDGIRRFVPVKMGGHKGVVFLPQAPRLPAPVS